MKLQLFAALVAATLVASADRTTEAGEALITDPSAECTAYSLAAVNDIKSTYPTIWETASLSFTGATAYDKALFAKMNSSIPKISPKGTRAGDFSSVSYNSTDPDCWHDSEFLWSDSLSAHLLTPLVLQAMTNEQAFAELYFSQKAIKDVLGITVRCWRPPYGDVDDRIRFIANALDMVTVLWEDDSFDWEESTIGIPAVKANYQAVLNAQTAGNFSKQGTIVLTHELNNETMTLSEDYLPAILQQFSGGVMPVCAFRKTFRVVAVCMNNTEPYLEKGAVYPNYVQWAAGTRTVAILSPTAATSDAQISYTSGGPATPSVTGPSVASGTLATSTATQVASSVTALGSATQGYTGAALGGSAAATASSNSSSSSTSKDSSDAHGKGLGGLATLLGSALALFLGLALW
ncbi:hypothetical protein P7C70_g3647, partial [Phenoliferia sp. Uapishka_3]